MLKKILIIFFVCLSLLGAYMLLVEPFQIKVVEKELVTAKWQAQKPIKIALIADVHAIWPWMTVDHVERIVEKTNDQEPDLILLLGDYVSTHPFGVQLTPENGLEPYKNLNAPCGIFFVLGNHDLHGLGSNGWPEALRNLGMPVLENRSVKVNCDDREFWISGLEDLWWQKPDIDKTLDYVTDDKPIIMMMHNPDSFVDVPERVALSVAGHTHGGQIRFPFIGSVESVIPSRYGKKFVYGHVQEDGKDLFVSSGLGTTGLPLRLLTPPQILLLTLSSELNNN